MCVSLSLSLCVCVCVLFEVTTVSMCGSRMHSRVRVCWACRGIRGPVDCVCPSTVVCVFVSVSVRVFCHRIVPCIAWLKKPASHLSARRRASGCPFVFVFTCYLCSFDCLSTCPLLLHFRLLSSRRDADLVVVGAAFRIICSDGRCLHASRTRGQQTRRRRQAVPGFKDSCRRRRPYIRAIHSLW